MPSCSGQDLDRFIGETVNYNSIFYKSLSKNDHQWADSTKSHQSGLLIPRQYYKFFGFDERPNRNSSGELAFEWFLNGNIHKRSDMTRKGGCSKTRVKYFCEGNRKSRPEIHLTCVYNPYFENLNDGSLLLIGQKENNYEGIIIDSEREDLLDKLRRYIDVPEGATWGVLGTSLVSEEAYIQEITVELFHALKEIATEKYRTLGRLPKTEFTATEVWNILPNYPEAVKRMVSGSGIRQSKDPFRVAVETYPGNLTRWALQKVEFQLVKFFEANHYPPHLIEGIQAHWGLKCPSSWSKLEEAFSVSLDDIVEVAKSLSQSRVSRAGNSFQWHISKLLDHRGIEYEPQSGERKIDFRLEDRINLSAKTSTRERWKEIYEGSYFITLDREINRDKLSKIQDREIELVVPESDKKSISHYVDNSGVMSFRDFFTSVQEGHLR